MTCELAVFTVDAFSSHPFSGNPAAVCLLPFESPIDDVVKQKIAAEINLAETAYVTQLSKEGSFAESSRFGLRWFTPTNEVPLCGHATLASAAVLFSAEGNQSSRLEFETQSGVLSATREGDYICLDFPQNPAQKQNHIEEYAELFKAASISEKDIDDVQYSQTTRKLLIRLKDHISRAELEQLDVSTQKLRAAHNSGKVAGVIVTVKSRSATQYDFFSRYFAPWVGISEDHVTGSAHTVLAPYWSEVLNKTELSARQCSRRGGDLRLQIMADDRVRISGRYVIVMHGHLSI